MEQEGATPPRNPLDAAFTCDLGIALSADAAYSIHHDPAAGQFTADVEGRTAYLAYRRIDYRTIEYYSTFVPPELRRRDIGGTLARHALAYAVEHRLTVVPSCWFVKRVMEKGGQGRQGGRGDVIPG